MSINKPVYINPTQGLSLPTYVTGQYLTNNGTTLSWAANGMGDLLANGTVPLTANWAMGAFELSQATWKGVAIAAGYGGTGLASYAVGDILHATGTTTVGKLADVAVGQVLASGGVGAVPAYTESPTLTGNLTASNLTASPTLAGTLLTNGDFTTDPTGTNTPWMEGTSTNIGTAWAWSAGKIRHATASTTTLRQVIAATSGQLVRVTFTIGQDGATPIAGTIRAYVGQSTVTGAGVSDIITAAAGTYVRDIYAQGTSTYYLTITPSTTFAGTIDDISAQIVTGNGAVKAPYIELSGQLKLAIGNPVTPTFCPANDLTNGLYWDINTELTWTLVGVQKWSMGYQGIKLGGTTLGWGTYIVNDLILGRDAAATLQLGVDGSPIAQTIKAHDATGDDVAGASITVAGGRGTDTGVGGSVKIATAPAGAAGSNNGTLLDRVEVDSTGTTKFLGANTQSTNIKQATAVVTTTAAATATATNLIPVGCMVVGVTTRVTTAVTGDAGFTGINIGDGTDADMFGANVSPLINATTGLANSTITTPVINTSAAKSVVLTQVGGSTFVAGGVVRVTVHYIDLTAPTT
jgi:hypothetical protein